MSLHLVEPEAERPPSEVVLAFRAMAGLAQALDPAVAALINELGELAGGISAPVSADSAWWAVLGCADQVDLPAWVAEEHPDLVAERKRREVFATIGCPVLLGRDADQPTPPVEALWLWRTLIDQAERELSARPQLVMNQHGQAALLNGRITVPLAPTQAQHEAQIRQGQQHRLAWMHGKLRVMIRALCPDLTAAQHAADARSHPALSLIEPSDS